MSEIERQREELKRERYGTRGAVQETFMLEAQSCRIDETLKLAWDAMKEREAG